jgi:hypothetical protein
MEKNEGDAPQDASHTSDTYGRTRRFRRRESKTISEIPAPNQIAI